MVYNIISATQTKYGTITWHDNTGQRPCAKLLCHIWLEWLKRLARSDLLYLSHFSILEHESGFIGKVLTRTMCCSSSTCMEYSSFVRKRQYMLIDWHWSGILWVIQKLCIWCDVFIWFIRTKAFYWYRIEASSSSNKKDVASLLAAMPIPLEGRHHSCRGCNGHRAEYWPPFIAPLYSPWSALLNDI